jgi:hypothetical protein
MKCWYAGDKYMHFMTANNVPMVPSSVITVTTGGECLMCDGFSLGETVRLGSFEFIADYFGSLSLSPKRGDSGATFMRSTHRGTPSPGCAMIEDSIKEFLTMSSGEGGGHPPLSQEAWHKGFARSRLSHTMDGEHSEHSGHDDG